jgi:hypothetical protein
VSETQAIEDLADLLFGNDGLSGPTARHKGYSTSRIAGGKRRLQLFCFGNATGEGRIFREYLGS